MKNKYIFDIFMLSVLIISVNHTIPEFAKYFYCNHQIIIDLNECWKRHALNKCPNLWIFDLNNNSIKKSNFPILIRIFFVEFIPIFQKRFLAQQFIIFWSRK